MVLVYRMVLTGKVFYVSTSEDTFVPDYEGDGTVGYAHGEIVEYMGVAPMGQQVETG